MAKPRGAARRHATPAETRKSKAGDGEPAAGSGAATQSVEPDLPPLRPQRRLLLVLAIGFAVWVAILVVMYFTTVAPRAPGKLRPEVSVLDCGLTRCAYTET